MSTTINITSVGAVAQETGAPVTRVLRVASELGIEQHKIDRVPYFDAHDAKRIAEHLAERRRKAKAN